MFLFGDRNIPNLDNTTSIYNSTSGSTIPSKINSCLIWGRWIHVWTYLNLYKWVWRNQHDQVIKWLWLSWLRSNFHLQKDGFLSSFAEISDVGYSPSCNLGFKVSSKKAAALILKLENDSSFASTNINYWPSRKKHTSIRGPWREKKAPTYQLTWYYPEGQDDLFCGQPKKNF